MGPRNEGLLAFQMAQKATAQHNKEIADKAAAVIHEVLVRYLGDLTRRLVKAEEHIAFLELPWYYRHYVQFIERPSVQYVFHNVVDGWKWLAVAWATLRGRHANPGTVEQPIEGAGDTASDGSTASVEQPVGERGDGAPADQAGGAA
jgi:hypothetical protein